jgi:hypothetical protein
MTGRLGVAPSHASAAVAPPTVRRRAWQALGHDALEVMAGKVAVGMVVLGAGFRAVSDDDFARVVLAQRFALEPKLDPTGTSWLPAPFWLYGSVMAALGRSLATARVLAFVLGVLSIGLVYLGARLLGVGRSGAVVGALVAAVIPYGALLGVATVPELPTAALCVLAIATTARPSSTLRLVGAGALLFACLSRYEPWALAVGFALITARDVARGELTTGPEGRRVGVLALGVALLGPAAWLVHNHLAHGDALHFLARVSAYKQAVSGVGAGETPLEAALAYPLAIVQKEPELGLAAIALGAQLLASRGARALASRPARRAIGLALLLVVALSAAAVRGGAPTHHAGRALLVVWLLLAVFVGARGRDLLRASRGALRVGLVGAALSLLALGVTILRPWYAHIGEFGHRQDEVAIGLAVGRLLPRGERALLEIGDYGYFAVQAGSGRPEAFVLDREVDPRTEPRPSSFASSPQLRARAQELGLRFAVGRRDAPAAVDGGLGAPLVSVGAWGLWELR